MKSDVTIVFTNSSVKFSLKKKKIKHGKTGLLNIRTERDDGRVIKIKFSKNGKGTYREVFNLFS